MRPLSITKTLRRINNRLLKFMTYLPSHQLLIKSWVSRILLNPVIAPLCLLTTLEMRGRINLPSLHKNLQFLKTRFFNRASRNFNFREKYQILTIKYLNKYLSHNNNNHNSIMTFTANSLEEPQLTKVSKDNRLLIHNTKKNSPCYWI